MPTLILASSSPYRKKLLERLQLSFECRNPDIDERPLRGETANELVARLAENKARAVADFRNEELIIGSDQVAVLDEQIIGKPGDRAGAIAQLLKSSGRTVQFLTGLCLLNSRSGETQTCVELFQVHFRKLEPAQIARYIDNEQPLSCAGSFKSEGLGISLFERLEGDDPNSLIGLPLIKLVSFLNKEGVPIP